MRLIFYLLLVIFLYSCREATSRLEQTLQLAGDNKLELQKVLDHYACDSLKLKAAIFLIENMLGHYSLDGPYLRQLQRIIDSTGTPYLMKKVILMQPLRYPHSRQQLRAEPDLEQVKADYLIHQIDQAFRLWTNSPWLEDLTLESFLEYLLPYRIGNEPLDYWRDSIDSRLRERLQEAGRYFDNQKHSPYNMAQIVYGHALGLDSGKDNLAGIPFSAKECVFSSQLQLLAYRMVGIPAAIDHVPYWADMNGFHEWTVVMDTKNKDILAGQIEMKNAPKVYRRTYSINPIPVPEKDEYIPPFFTNPFNRDVTNKYLHTSDITVTATVPVQARHAYLAIFNGRELRVVDWSDVQQGKAHFHAMGSNIVYFPVYFEKEYQRNFAYPFILRANGTTVTLRPDTTRRQTLTLTRKYPLHHNKVYHGNALVGARFQASNDPTFRNPVTIHSVTHNPNMQPEIVPVDTTQKYRYWRFNHTKIVELAEWRFKDKRGLNLTGKSIDPEGRGARLANIFDNDPLSHGRISHQLVVDFDHPVSVSEIIYLPRNDANGVYPGNEYELLYFDLGGWQSLGCKIATGYSVEFENVPSNAVYWLRNHTAGKEERVFTIQNGEQRFW